MFSPFYLSSFGWNFAHGMAQMLVPLYALALGMSGVAIGSLVALPVFLQFVFNLVGGAAVDRLGAKNILYAACISSFAYSIIYLLSEGYWGLLVGQSLNVLSRATFWPASYALSSQMPGERSVNLGRLNSITNAGQIGGTAAAGLLIGAVGFVPAFWLGACVALATFLITIPVRDIVPRRGHAHSAIQTYVAMARLRPMYYGIACAALSVLPFTVANSFGAILIVSEGYTSGETGWLLTLRAFGAIFAGAVIARYVHSAYDRRVAISSCAAMALTISLTAASGNAWLIGASLFALGTASGVISVYFQLLMSAVSSAAQRGSAMSFGGLGWNISNLLAPLMMGFLMDAMGIHSAFHILGALLLVCAVLFMPFYGWAFKELSANPGHEGR